MAGEKCFTDTAAYAKLKIHLGQVGGQHLRTMFQKNPERGRQFAVATEHIYLDYSRQRVTAETIQLLQELACERELGSKIEAMFKGEKINRSENRAVLHTALRNLSGDKVLVDGHDVMPEVRHVCERVYAFANEVISGNRCGATGRRFKNIVAIGIGGSYLGPQFSAAALRPYAQKDMNLVFVANVDGTDFIEKSARLLPEETMVIVISKTFTTAETMQNAITAKKWLLKGLDNHADAIRKHFVAVSTAQDKVEAFGIDTRNMFGFWDWVGGRFSVTSAVGALALSLYLGVQNFAEILRGAHWLDRHFRTAPWSHNIPLLCAFNDIWNINFLGYKSRALLPYSQALSQLPLYTQQTEMESNGKCVDSDGNALSFATGEVVFGEAGTNGQHSFYQLLHQGTQIIPADFIGFLKPSYDVGEATDKNVTHHEELMTNFFAQPDALAFGKDDTVLCKHFHGNRPSSSFLLPQLTPFSVGLLLALTEHRAAVKGFIWGINSYDQFGVELGKKLGVEHRNRMLHFHATQKIETENLNTSTATLLTAFLKGEMPRN
jgi:glucose-6-phosphate isomerase